MLLHIQGGFTIFAQLPELLPLVDINGEDTCDYTAQSFLSSIYLYPKSFL